MMVFTKFIGHEVEETAKDNFVAVAVEVMEVTEGEVDSGVMVMDIVVEEVEVVPVVEEEPLVGDALRNPRRIQHDSYICYGIYDRDCSLVVSPCFAASTANRYVVVLHVF